MGYCRKVGQRWKAEARVMVRGEKLADDDYFDSKASAQAWCKMREAELRGEQQSGFKKTTVRQLLEKWRDEVAPTRDGAKWDINRINATIREFSDLGYCDLDLADFKPKHMAAWRELRLDKVQPISVHRGETLLKSIWADARHPKWNLTDQDPFKNLGGIKGSSGKPRDRKATWPEIKRILRQLDYHPRKPEINQKASIGLAMLVALRTTLRDKEVLQLSDDSVNLTKMVLTIDAHKTKYRTNESKRVPLLPKALLLLARKCLGKGKFFDIPSGSRDVQFRRARDLANVKDLTFHDFKRTSIAYIKRHISLDDMLSVTGNKDATVLRRHYMTDTAEDAAVIVWKLLGHDRLALLKRLGLSPDEVSV